MKVLITAATHPELAAIESMIIAHPNQDIHVAVTGIGMIATTYHLMDRLQEIPFDLMIQIGIAGCFDHQYNLGNAVAIQSESIAEMGVVEQDEYKDIFDLRLTDLDEPPYQGKLLVNPHADLLSLSPVPKLSAVTVNQISTAETVISRYKNTYQASIESMEGAAFHYVGLLKQIPFIQFRGISNYVGDRNKSNWKIKEAIQSSTLACWNLLQQLHVK
jgi:futalosine hydrolase